MPATDPRVIQVLVSETDGIVGYCLQKRKRSDVRHLEAKDARPEPEQDFSRDSECNRGESVDRVDAHLISKRILEGLHIDHRFEEMIGDSMCQGDGLVHGLAAQVVLVSDADKAADASPQVIDVC